MMFSLLDVFLLSKISHLATMEIWPFCFVKSRPASVWFIQYDIIQLNNIKNGKVFRISQILTVIYF